MKFWYYKVVPNQRSIIVGVLLGLIAIVALSLFVISTLNPIKLAAPKINLLNFPPTVLKTAPVATSSSTDWQLPVASPSAEQLFLVIINPSNNLVTSSNQIKVSGQTATNAKITLNEQPLAINSDGSYQAMAGLAPGENEFVITAANEQGAENIQTALVLSSPNQEGTNLQVASTLGVVSKITGDNYQITTDKGVATEFEVNPLTKYLRKYGAESTKESILEGQEVEVVGVGTEALLVRNLSLNEHTGYLSGTISTNSGTTNLTTDAGQEFFFAPGAFNQSAVKNGQKVYLLADFDPHSQRINRVTQTTTVWN